jgi:2-polyprenyl-6-methoxyphenol hydroxylase-like FAD-dependent oxidoreductase
MTLVSGKVGWQAVVIGGSMAGLLASRVLADYFEKVTILERDRFPADPQPRKGVPQARHTHILLLRGQQQLEKLFPGIQDELQQAGAPRMDWINDLCSYVFTGLMPRFPSHYQTHPCSRDLLEWSIRHRVTSLTNLHIVEGADVNELLMDERRGQVSGVRFTRRDHPGSQGENMLADLVVDASGRESKAATWLKSLGYALPAEIRINSFLGYASRGYQSPLGWSDWTVHLVRGLPPHDRRGGVIYANEHGRWAVTLAGAGRDYPPIDEAGFLDFARSLAVPTLYNALREAQPITPISGYRRTENRWRQFERLPRWPDNFIVLGDAVCAFNPVYGQGMTVAAEGAMLLDECLQELRLSEPNFRQSSEKSSAGSLGIDFQKRLARMIKTPWMLATGDDFRFAETEGGQRTVITRWMHAYVDRVVYAALADPRTYQTFFEVTHLVRPVSSLFAPQIVAQALKK